MVETVRAYQGDACIAAVRAAMPQVSAKILKDMANQMEVHMKHAEPGFDPQVALQQAVTKVSDRMRRKILAQKYQAYKNLLVTKRNHEYITNNFADRPFIGLKARMAGISSDIPGSRWSAASQQNQLLDDYLSGLTGDLERRNLLNPLLHGDEDFHRAVTLELERMGRETELPGTGNPEAKTSAELIHKWQEKARLDANGAGASIGKIQGYIVRQTHDMYRVKEIGRVAWKDLIRDKLDWKQIEIEQGSLIKDYDKFLDDIYNGIVSGTHRNHSDVPSNMVAANVSRSLSHDRVLHFLPGQWYDYNLQAGSRSVLDAAVHGLELSARTTGLMRAWGPSAVHNMDNMVSRLKLDFPEKAEEFSEFWYKALQRELTGESHNPGNHMLAKAGLYQRTLENVTKLGGAVITAGIVDPVVMASELRYQGASALKGYAVALKADFKSLKSKEKQATAKALGIMMQGVASHFHGRLDAEGMMPGNISKINALYFKLNLLTPHTDRLRLGAAEAMATMSAEYSNLAWGSLPAKYQRVLSLFGIDEVDWSLISKYGVDELDGTRMMTPEKIGEIPDEIIQAARGGEDQLTSRQVSQIREDLKSKYHSYLVDRADIAVLKPDQRTASYQHMGTQEGTSLGVLVRGLMQFKGFPIGFIQKVLGREIYGGGAKNLREAAASRDVLGGLSWLMFQSTVAGYGVMAVKDMLAGKDVPNPNELNVWKEAAMRGGGLGFYGDILFGELRKEWGRGGVSSLLGPGASTADDILDIAGRFRDGELKSVNLVKFAYRHGVPNLFYTKMALDYGFLYQAMEELDPGSVRKMERRYQTEHDRGYWLSPSESVR